MKVLFIGGTGIISSACSERAIQKGIELFHFNRGKSFRIIEGVRHIAGDIRSKKEAASILGKHEFDAVVEWIGFVPEQIATDIELFSGRTRQYIFISSASAYEKPPARLPITERTPLTNPFWQYSRDKIACENLLMKEYRTRGFPVTIVRPSHTYDKTLLPTDWGYTVIDRMRKGKKVIVHGDGTSLWVLTHHRDFAVGFTGLLGNRNAIGEAYHITSDELLTWNRIYTLLADALSVEPHFIHVPSEAITRLDPDMGPNLLGDKAHSVIFDNTKIKSLVPEFKADIPFSAGVKEIISFYLDNPAWQKIDAKIDQTIELIIGRYDS
jgi:nucleoside-diphosphate-sugar epimerase